MFNKKALSLAVAAAATGLSVGAMAQIDVTAGENALLIANESVTPLTTGVLPVGTAGGSTALNIQSELGIGVAENDQIFIRYDFSSAEFASDLAVGNIDVDAGTASTGLTDGQTGDSTAIFGVLAPTGGFAQDALAVLDLDGFGVQLSGSSSDVRVRVFETQAAAINEALPLSDQSFANAIALGDAIRVSFSPETATAEVTTNFTEFTTGTTGALGSFSASANTNFFLASTLAPVAALTDLALVDTNSVVTYTGDFSFATTANGYYISTNTATCVVGTPLAIDTSTLTTATSTLDVANDNLLCVTVNGDDEIIPEATYDASVNLVHVVTTSSPNSTTADGSVGEIERNGTTVEVAYITTFSEYNQRLLINSRHPVPAEYTITFQSEDGVTTEALGSATGVLQPGENLVLRAQDIVAITGGTRCSATVVVVAPEGNISVATTQVNLSDGGTDTVSYN